MCGSELKQYELYYKHIAAASYGTVIVSVRLYRMKLCNESMRYGQFSLKNAHFYSSPAPSVQPQI